MEDSLSFWGMAGKIFGEMGGRRKGFAVAASTVMILTVIFLGIFLLLGTQRGATPIYYQNMPESKFGNLLMTYEHIKENVKDVFGESSDKVFLTMSDFPFKWSDFKDKASISDEEWSGLYQDKFASATENYFTSVKNLGFEWIEIKNGESTVEYHSSSAGSNNPTMTWNFVYHIKIQNMMPREGIYNRIDSNETAAHYYDNFINLENARMCARDFFAAANKKKISFGDEQPNIIRGSIEQALNQITPSSSCMDFDLSAKVHGEIDCGSSLCNGGNLKSVDYVLFITGKTSSGSQGKSGAISFLNQFTGFAKGLSNSPAISCSTGSGCKDSDCVEGVCGICLASLEGTRCSPSGSSSPMSSYKCYKTDSGDFKCLENSGSIWITNGDTKIEDGKILSLNCAIDKKSWSIGGLSSGQTIAAIRINGIIIPATKALDLCDASKVPPANGQLEIYLDAGNGEKYKAFGSSVIFALDTCIGGLNKKLDGYTYTFSEGTFDELKKGLTQSLKDVIKTVPCESYTVTIPEDGISFSCAKACTMTDKTSWDKEKYSRVTLEIKETSSTVSVASPSYIISYSP